MEKEENGGREWNNFKIPKRKLDEFPESSSYSSQLEAYKSLRDELFPSINSNPNVSNNDQFYPSTPLYDPYGNVIEPITQQICQTLSSQKEKPKTYKNNLLKETIPDCDDETLPKELTSMFQPLYCKLCSAQLSSNIMAKTHYKSRKHEKKIKHFLVLYSERTGEPLHKRARLSSKAVDPEAVMEPKYFHCDVCDLPLTGKMHAESHYMGRNHQRALMGYKAPAGQGYYNEEGKWVRLKAKPKSNLADGEDTFGMDFRKRDEPVTVQSVSAYPVAPPPPVISGPQKFFCEVCGISTTCAEQLETHYNGKNHKRKLKALNVLSTGEPIPEVPDPNELLTAAAAQQKLDKRSLAVYRTPSGNYYCQTCNLALNSEIQFKVHLQSKNHHKKMMIQKANNG